MATTIFEQKNCNYRHIADVAAMITPAAREIEPDAEPDVVRALNYVSSAVSGTNDSLYFAVAECDGVTAGFIGGMLVPSMIDARSIAQDLLAYVKPEYRRQGIGGALQTAFEAWAFDRNADEVRALCVSTTETGEQVVAAAERRGFCRVGVMVAKKRGA